VSLTHYPDRNITSNCAMAYFNATGPCSLLEPRPKFRPTTTISTLGQIPKASFERSNDYWLLAHSHKYLLGSAILPSIADAATVAGDARYTFDESAPILPTKFREDDDMQFSFSPSTPR
jgi:hypothetical protein